MVLVASKFFHNSHIHLTDSQTKSFRRTCANQSLVVICPVKCLACKEAFRLQSAKGLGQRGGKKFHARGIDVN